jgi:hypothetical protein
VFGRGLAAKKRLFEMLQPALVEQRDALLAEGHIRSDGNTKPRCVRVCVLVCVCVRVRVRQCFCVSVRARARACMVLLPVCIQGARVASNLLGVPASRRTRWGH